MGTSDTSDLPRNINRWSGMCYYRHGGDMFPGWWQHRRSDFGASKCTELPWDDILLSWDAVVYVRVRVDREHLRDEYLKYIGGQNKVYCQTHNVPLIVSDQKSAEHLICSRKLTLKGVLC